MKRKLVSNQRGYKVVDTSDAKKLSGDFLQNEFKINKTDITFGLPEIDDRFHIWRVPIRKDKEKIGEVVINAKNGPNLYLVI